MFCWGLSLIAVLAVERDGEGERGRAVVVNYSPYTGSAQLHYASTGSGAPRYGSLLGASRDGQALTDAGGLESAGGIGNTSLRSTPRRRVRSGPYGEWWESRLARETKAGRST